MRLEPDFDTMTQPQLQDTAPSSFGLEPRRDFEISPPVDSGVGSSLPSKQSSKALDSSDTDAIQQIAAAAKRGRKRTFNESKQSTDFEDEFEPNLNLEAVAEVGDGLGAAADVSICESKRVCSGIRAPYPVYPRSLYEGYESELPREKERTVIQDFQRNEQKGDGDISDDPDFFIHYRLDDFSIYHPLNDKRLSGEHTCLSNICTRGGFDLLFDGILSDGQQRRYVEKIPFKVLSVGNYTDLTKHDVSQSLWIQSAMNSRSNIWYELGSPSSAYENYWTPFVWLANFAKHFVDFLSEHELVVLQDFKYKFSKWIKTHHAGHESFDRWYNEYGKDDFRQPVAVHRDWLWNQTCCYSQKLGSRHIWNEVLHLRSVKSAPGAWVEKTVVTPYVHQCFEHMFGDKMMVVKPPAKDTPSKFDGVHIPSPIRAKRDQNGDLAKVDSVKLKVGDVVAIQKDEGTEWQSTSNTWFAYVQSIQYHKKDTTKPYALDVIWLYAPSDTTLAKERYPYFNELFFSDHCNCSEDKLYASDVITTLAVRFFEGPNDGKEYFIRQKYRSGDPAFLTLTKEDLEGCRHKRILKSPYQTITSQYQVGDTVLVGAVLDGNKDILEPVEICHFEDSTSEVHVRVLGRRSTLEEGSKARPNELLYTDKIVSINPQFIHRRCHVRFVQDEDVVAGKIPLPYDRDGTGDCFYISSYLCGPDSEQAIQPFKQGEFPKILREGFDLDVPPDAPILNGLDLFCGGGNFGRGIEEGGVVNMKWAVDIDVPAIHTYGANLRTPDETALYLGSINNYLRDAIQGKTSYVIAGPGEVGFISAGSPCQGFSNANRNKFSEKSLRNCSLVASVATAVDFYRPKYALLENVHGMAATRIMPDKREINVFSQLLCCLVGMGYQCQQLTLDAWSFGSPQSRTRLFLSIAAPGQRLPPRPPRSHEHPSAIRDLSLFKAPNGLKFGGRELVGPCTYPAPTSRAAFDDLPFLGNNHVGICIPYPDHRISRVESSRTRTIMAHVPKHGTSVHQNSWRAAMKAGRMPKGCGYETSISEYKVRDGCKTWSRIMGDALCRTVTTTLTPQCSYTGQWVHYDQDRLVTILEARRAQSFPDDEVLLGNASQAFKIVGNSVARSVALAWGLAIRYAYLDEIIQDELAVEA